MSYQTKTEHFCLMDVRAFPERSLIVITRAIQDKINETILEARINPSKVEIEWINQKDKETNPDGFIGSFAIKLS